MSTTVNYIIASPLTEELYANRTYYAPLLTRSTDGLFAIATKPLKSITFKDANNKTAQLNFKDAPRV